MRPQVPPMLRFTLFVDCPGDEWQGGTLCVTCPTSDQGLSQASTGGPGGELSATFSLADSEVSLAMIEAKMASLSKPQVSPVL